MKRLAAICVGGVLACLPFLLYGGGGHAHAPHTDHDPRHGGQLFMIGDYHLELVTRGETGSSALRVEIYLSDASRRPLRPRAGALATRAGDEIALAWTRQRLVAELPKGARPARYRLTAPDGSTLELPAPR